MKKYRMPLLVVVIAIAILAVPVVASASHQWGKYKWNSPAPVTLTIGDNVSSTWDANLDIAISDWNTSTVLGLTEAAGAANNRVDCIPATGTIEVCNNNYGANGWLGIATIWISKGKNIAKGSSRMNDYYFENVAPYNTDADTWRQMVMCQEIGHDFGLTHQDTNFSNDPLGTCMDYTSGPLSTADQHPNGHDYDQLVSMYADGGGGGGGGGNGGPPAGKGKRGGVAGLVNSEWGRAIGTDASGRPNEFERDLGSGNKVLTHVLWAN